MLTTDSALQWGSGLSKASRDHAAFLSAFPQEQFTFYRPETRDLVGLNMLPKVSLNKMHQNQDLRDPGSLLREPPYPGSGLVVHF